MEKKMEVFLNNIGINEDYLTYFENSYIEKVLINKSTNRFSFIFNLDQIIPIEVYDDLNQPLYP